MGNWKTTLMESNGASGGIGGVWTPEKIGLNIMISNNNWIGCRVISFTHNLKMILINVYGPTQTTNDKKLWDDIGSDLLKVYH